MKVNEMGCFNSEAGCFQGGEEHFYFPATFVGEEG